MRITSTPLSRAMSSAARNDMISLVSWRVSDAKLGESLKMTFSESQNYILYIILMNTLTLQIIISWFSSKKRDENGREVEFLTKYLLFQFAGKKSSITIERNGKNNNWPLQLHSTLPRPRSDLDRHQQSQPPALHWHGFPHSPCTLFFQACSKSWLRHTISQGCCQTAISFTKKKSRHAHERRLEFSRNPSYYLVHFNIKIQKVVISSHDRLNTGTLKMGWVSAKRDSCWTYFETTNVACFDKTTNDIRKYMECYWHPGC